MQEAFGLSSKLYMSLRKPPGLPALRQSDAAAQDALRAPMMGAETLVGRSRCGRSSRGPLGQAHPGVWRNSPLSPYC